MLDRMVENLIQFDHRDINQWSKKSIFLSYRRRDVSGIVGRLASNINNAFGFGICFYDIGSLMSGDPWKEKLISELQGVKILLWIIGEKWDDLDNKNNRKILNPDDPLHIELNTAITRKIKIIPVTINNAQMPSKSQLPNNLHQAIGHQAIKLVHEQWNLGVDRLIADIGHILNRPFRLLERYQLMKYPRAARLIGEWHGALAQGDMDEQRVQFNGALKFFSIDKTIYGKSIVNTPFGDYVKFDLYNGSFSNELFRFDYKNESGSILQEGHFIFKMNASDGK